MAISPERSFNFNNQDYEFTIRIYNGIHDVYLNSAAWEDLFLEEDIFDWKIKGSVIVRSEYETFERASNEAVAVMKQERSNLVYKFRNDCRDTIFISIKPLKPQYLRGLEDVPNSNFKDKIWRIELEGVIYDTEDLPNDGIDKKRKKLYFWEKTYQMMLEKDSEYSTANTGSNANKKSTQTSNADRSLTTVESVGALLLNDEEFRVHAQLVNTSEWETGDEKTKIFFSSPVGAKFIDNLNYLLNYTVSSANDNYQPCIFKFERAEQSLLPKQFSLKSIKKYFQKAGKEQNSPGEYQNEHFFIYGNTDSKNPFAIRKAPLSNDGINLNGEIKGDNTHTIRGYRLVDLSGLDYSTNLTDYRVVAYNSTDGQYSDEGNKHQAKEYKDFFSNSIKPYILTNNVSDRLVFTPYIRDGKNTKTVYSLRTDELSRLADGRNRLLKYYLFANLAISFDVQGSTHRQTGRFFGVSKQNDNQEEFDHKLEGQYFLTNIVHHFNNSNNSYMTRLVGVKTHTYEEKTSFTTSNVSIINPEQQNKTNAETPTDPNTAPPEESSLLPNESSSESPSPNTTSPRKDQWTPWTSPSEPLDVEPNQEGPDASLFPPLDNSREVDSNDTFENRPPSSSENLLPNTPGRFETWLLEPPPTPNPAPPLPPPIFSPPLT